MHAGDMGRSVSLEILTSADSLLLQLPPELRNAIYELALYNPEAVVWDSDEHRFTKGPALLQANRQTRSEAWAIFWTINTFQIISESENHRAIAKFAMSIGPKKWRMIRRLHVYSSSGGSATGLTYSTWLQTYKMKAALMELEFASEQMEGYSLSEKTLLWPLRNEDEQEAMWLTLDEVANYEIEEFGGVKRWLLTEGASLSLTSA